MPTRPESHEINSAGDALLRVTTPPQWALRAQHENDYGIDYEVEIFGPDRESRAELFKVQLKSSGNLEEAETVRLNLELAELDYWNQLPLPVLIVLADVRFRRLWAAWSTDLDPHPRRQDQVTKTFRLGPSDRFGAERVDSLEKRVVAWRAWRNRDVAFPLGVVIKNEMGLNGDAAVADVRACLRRALTPPTPLTLRNRSVSGIELRVVCGMEETRFATPGGRDLVIDAPITDWWTGATPGDLLACLGLALFTSGWTREGRFPHRAHL